MSIRTYSDEEKLIIAKFDKVRQKFLEEKALKSIGDLTPSLMDEMLERIDAEVPEYKTEIVKGDLEAFLSIKAAENIRRTSEMVN